MKNFKRIIAIALLIATLMLSTIAYAAKVGDKVVTTGKCNLREGPGKGYDVIRTVKKGTSLTRLDSKRDKRGVIWYEVRMKDGTTGWVSGVFSDNGNPSGKGKLVTTGSANIRNKASLNGRIIKTVPAGKTFKYTDSKKDNRGVRWYLVTIGDTAGWISSKNVRKK